MGILPRPLSTRPDKTDLYHGLFRRYTAHDGQPCLSRHEAGPPVIPCPTTGRPLTVSTVDAGSQAICPKCECHGRGGFVSFVGDLRMAYACPGCGDFVWLAGV
jgi:hypothetical protein